MTTEEEDCLFTVDHLKATVLRLCFHPNVKQPPYILGQDGTVVGLLSSRGMYKSFFQDILFKKESMSISLIEMTIEQAEKSQSFPFNTQYTLQSSSPTVHCTRTH